MEQLVQKKKRRRMIRKTGLILIGILFLWVGFHHCRNLYETLKYQARGKLVQVNGEHMNVTQKEGVHTQLYCCRVWAQPLPFWTSNPLRNHQRITKWWWSSLSDTDGVMFLVNPEQWKTSSKKLELP
ncbi:hypothetical protein CUU66_10230 [Peribacillus deserti]|uniref:Uncharacterized protein n=1 Tax=Peribacillus deserti TaxID=673318 RepID=A0A2N5M6B3_9BACI|nr:hypothetical protein CUU66_10230 [Peribacillus deserti]